MASNDKLTAYRTILRFLPHLNGALDITVVDADMC
jgi:hypothetical protein